MEVLNEIMFFGLVDFGTDSMYNNFLIKRDYDIKF